MELKCDACKDVAELECYAFDPASDFLRCPKCGDTKNRYNAAHASLIEEVVSGKREGPILHGAVVQRMESDAKKRLGLDPRGAWQ